MFWQVEIVHWHRWVRQSQRNHFLMVTILQGCIVKKRKQHWWYKWNNTSNLKMILSINHIYEKIIEYNNHYTDLENITPSPYTDMIRKVCESVVFNIQHLAVSKLTCYFSRIRNSIALTRWSYDHFIHIMEFPILEQWFLPTEIGAISI